MVERVRRFNRTVTQRVGVSLEELFDHAFDSAVAMVASMTGNETRAELYATRLRSIALSTMVEQADRLAPDDEVAWVVAAAVD